MTLHVSRFLVLATLLLMAAAPAAADPPRVLQAEGPVEISVGDPPVWHAAQPGETLAAGASIRLGEGARAELALEKGTIRLYENSLLRLPADAFGAGETTAVELEEGGSLFDIDKSKNRNGFEVRTPEAVVMVKGTRFAVSIDGGAAAVAVFRGLVGVRSLVATLEHEILVREGFTAVGGGPRAFELHFDRTPDPWKAWGSKLPAKLRRPVRIETPASIAVDETRRAAVRDARRALLRQALKNNPALRRSVRKRVAARAALQRATEKGLSLDQSFTEETLMKLAEQYGTELLTLSTEQQAQLEETYGIDPSKITAEQYAELLELYQSYLSPDPMTQSANEDLALTMQGSLAEEVLNSGSSGSVNFVPLEINRVTSGGPNFLEFLDQGTIVATMSESNIDQFLQTGSLSLVPQPVIDNMTSSGLSSKDYFELLATIYF
jgi:hypothetical protein